MTVRTVLKVPFEKADTPCPSVVPAPLVGGLEKFKFFFFFFKTKIILGPIMTKIHKSEN